MVTATDVLNWSYCPRIIYFTHVLKKPQITTPKEYKGREKSVEYEKKGKRTKIVKKFPKYPKLFNVHLSSPDLGMKTRVDSVLMNEQEGEAYPIQAKWGFKPRVVYKGTRNQLLMESCLIENCLGYRCNYGFIKYLRSGELVKVNLNRIEALEECLKGILSTIKSEVVPKATPYKKRCVDCCFRNICGD